jgi:zinc protease
MRSLYRTLSGLLFCLMLVPSLLVAQVNPPAGSRLSIPPIDIPYTKYVLGNGLILIVHEDHKAPIVAVNIWYHVGSKNEKFGKTGFAHLFEHLMFNGSENSPGDYFQVLERLGATDLNGTTSEDRTNYFQNVPVSALDTVLWLESDRMGHLLGAIDQKTLDEQRGVVQNEKRQGENEPYAISDELITRACFPASHPYSHTVIGSMEDLGAASLEDVKEWFRTYYGPPNAVLAIAGDITAATAKQKVEKYFGDIPPGPPVAHFKEWVAPRSGSQRQSALDRVAQARLLKVWNVPSTGTPDGDYLNLVSDVLSGDKASRLYKRLVYDEQIATSVSASLDSREIGSLFVVQANARPGEDLVKIEKAVNEEIGRLLAEGPTQDELDRVRTRYFAEFVRGAERIGGFGGKSDILASNQVFHGSPDAFKLVLDHVGKASVGDLQRAAKKWLADGDYTLQIFPYPGYEAAAQVADRSKMPEPSQPPTPIFPAMQTAQLSNGLKLIVAERHSIPVINFNLLVDSGYAADQFALAGTASLALNMLDEGTTTKNALDISKELSRLGATLGSGSNLDTSFVNLSVLKSNLDPALALYADVILKPAFRAEDFQRLQRQQIALIQREKTEPISMALRVFPRLLYGQGHAYGNPFSGSGTEASVGKLTREELVKFHQTWFKPDNATLVIVGDTTLAEIRPKIEALFSSWKPASVPKKNLSTVALADKPSVYIIDKPGAQQSVILAGHAAPPKSNPDEIAITTVNTVLGGVFISRLNMNIREDKHWSYGAGSFLPNARGQRPFIAYAPVQSDKTKEAVSEILKELREVIGTRPLDADELAMAKSNLTLSLPGSWETNDAVSASINEIVEFQLPADYYATYPAKIRATTLDDTKRAAAGLVHPGSIVWVVVGDREKIEKGLRELNLGELRFIDADGNPVK